MKPQISKTLHALLIPFLLLTFTAPRQINLAVSNPAWPADSELKFPGPDDEFIVYYKSWPNDDAFFKRMGERYKLIILNTDDLVPADDIKNNTDKVLAYKQGRIKMLRDLGAMVFGYLSIGSENLETNSKKPYPGDGKGPCSGADSTDCTNKGIASYYIDKKKGKGKPEFRPGKKSAPVNPGNDSWKSKMNEGAKEIMALGCTGLFLDTVDDATDAEWKQAGTMILLKELHDITPNIVVNRGLVLLKTDFADDYRKLTWAIMFEDFFTDWDDKKGGFQSPSWSENLKYVPLLKDKNVLVVDFAFCKQLNDTDKDKIVAQQKLAVKEHGTNWPSYLADHDFKEVRYKSQCEKPQ